MCCHKDRGITEAVRHMMLKNGGTMWFPKVFTQDCMGEYRRYRTRYQFDRVYEGPMLSDEVVTYDNYDCGEPRGVHVFYSQRVTRITYEVEKDSVVVLVSCNVADLVCAGPGVTGCRGVRRESLDRYMKKAVGYSDMYYRAMNFHEYLDSKGAYRPMNDLQVVFSQVIVPKRPIVLFAGLNIIQPVCFERRDLHV